MKTTVERIKEIIAEDEYDVYGLRADNEIVYSVGDTCYPSREVYQDEQDGMEYDESIGMWVGEELSGTCALKVDENTVEEMLKNINFYGHHITLIAGYGYEFGYDDGEIIIDNATVLAVVE